MVAKLRHARIFKKGIFVGALSEIDNNGYLLKYTKDYAGKPISLTLPVEQQEHAFDTFPTFFDGLLPEGPQLEALLKQTKLDRNDYFGQLLEVGGDLVGDITVQQ